jgi:glycosyltransferase involved in cell wall biosynthesis
VNNRHSLRIAINATCIGPSKSGALQRFLGLYHALASSSPDCFFVIYLPFRSPLYTHFRQLPNIKIRITPIPYSRPLVRFIFSSIYFSLFLLYDRIDILEQLHLPIPLLPLYSKKILTTIHDLRPIEYRITAPSSILYVIALSAAVRFSDAFLSVSSVIRRNLVSLYPGVPVYIVPNGLASSSSSKPLSQIPPDIIPDGDYILSVGHLEPRKNYSTLLSSLQLLGSRGISMPLVIVGKDRGSYSALSLQIKESGLEDLVTIVSNLDDQTLCALYRSAKLFVFPSVYEGFGIPILEALSHGLPLILSDLPVFHEIAQDLAKYFPHDNPKALADLLVEVSLGSAQSSFVQAAAARVDLYGYDQLALRHRSVYSSLFK